MIASGGLSGGISSTIAGGDFWQGMRQGLITSGLNHLIHMGLDNGYDKEGNKINDNGGDVMDIRYDDDGSILEIRDVELRIGEKVGAASSVPLVEFGIRRFRMATGQVTSIGGAFDLFGLKEAFWNFFSGNDNVPYDFKLGAGGFRGGKGERNFAAKASGTNNPYKHLRVDSKIPGNVKYKHRQSGKTISRPATAEEKQHFGI